MLTKKVINNIYLIIIELCCAFCVFKKLHEGHKILEIEDEESLKKENITIDDATKEFDINIKKMDDLQKSIEHEMVEIDKTYEKVDNEITKSYELKREKLNKEEEDLKERLKTEVTKIKEKLEKHKTEVDYLSKINERIKKGIISLEKEEKNMLKTLSYVSKINKNQRFMKSLFKELMKNLKITYIEEESKIKYEEYYFNGIPTPKNIELKDIGKNSVKVFWTIDDINKNNFKKDELNYKIGIRKDNTNDNFTEIYVKKNLNFLINNLKENTNYELRICSIYNDIVGNWSESFKIKTLIIDSLILNETERRDEFLNKLYEWTGYKNMELLHRGTRDGSGSNVFHNKCDNQGPTLCLCKNDKGNIFGGYASISWKSPKEKWEYTPANNCFLFTLTNIHGTAPTQFPCIKSEYSLQQYAGSGPDFGNNDLRIYSDYLNQRSQSYLGNSYQDVLGKGRSIFTGDANNNNGYFQLKEMEVFKLFN